MLHFNHFRKNCLMGHGKPLGLLCFLEAFAQPRKSLYSLGKTGLRGTIQNHVHNPYKTCRFLVPLESFTRKLPQNTWKTIRIIVFP